MLPSPKGADRDVKRILSLDGGGGDIVALCPGAKLKPTDAVSSPVQCLPSTAKQFRVGSADEIVDFKDIACSKSIKEVIKKSEGESCGPEDDRGEMLHIGWQDDDVFHPQESLSKSWLKTRSGPNRPAAGHCEGETFWTHKYGLFGPFWAFWSLTFKDPIGQKAKISTR